MAARMLHRLALCGTILTLGWGIAGAQRTPDAAVAKPDWKTLQSAYAYDRSRPLYVTEEERSTEKAYQVHLSFPGTNSEKVPGFFSRPKAKGVYPCILLLHGLTSRKEDMLRRYGETLVQKGFAVLALDAPKHGERRIEGENLWSADVLAYAIRRGIPDYRAALDYLGKRKDVDPRRIGLIGYSMGSFMGAILGGVDRRVSAFVLCVSGDPILNFVKSMSAEKRAAGYTVCPSFYVGRIAPRPLLMLNGKQDDIVTPAATKVLFENARQPKEVVWYEAGHGLRKEADDKAISWLIARFKSRPAPFSTSGGVARLGSPLRKMR